MGYTPLYTANATSKGGRNGHVETSDGVVKHELSTPKEMGGAGKAGATNPEQLFACGYSACFAGALSFIAGREKKTIGDFTVTAHVTFGKEDSGAFQLAVVLDVTAPALPHDEVQKLVEAAHQVCPYSRATRNNIEVKLNVV